MVQTRPAESRNSGTREMRTECTFGCLDDRIADAERDAKQSSRVDPDSYVDGYDRGFLDALVEIRATSVLSQAAKFIVWVMQEGPWSGGDLDGGSVQDKAESLGLLSKVKYDPELHGESDFSEPGDDWFVLRPEIVQLSKAPSAVGKSALY
ncbi:hypothetical protein V1291_000079 [Nitrobacteraceae bacterium AZCC 1564]